MRAARLAGLLGVVLFAFGGVTVYAPNFNATGGTVVPPVVFSDRVTQSAGFDSSASSTVSAIRVGDTTAATATLDIQGRFKVAGASGIPSAVNNEATASIGLPYILATGQDVASSGAGAQNTTIATFTIAATGLYEVVGAISGTTADTVSVVTTYVDAVTTTTQTKTLVADVALGLNGTASFYWCGRVKGPPASTLLVKITNSSQTTTKASAVLRRSQ